VQFRVKELILNAKKPPTMAGRRLFNAIAGGGTRPETEPGSSALRIRRIYFYSGLPHT
jgi:hypothetical protein